MKTNQQIQFAQIPKYIFLTQKKVKQLEKYVFFGLPQLLYQTKKVYLQVQIIELKLKNCSEKFALFFMMTLSKVTKNAQDVRESNLPKTEDKLKQL